MYDNLRTELEGLASKIIKQAEVIAPRGAIGGVSIRDYATAAATIVDKIAHLDHTEASVALIRAQASHG